MFGLFGSTPYQDDQLGTLERSGGYWACDCALPPQGTFRVKLSGNRQAPDATSLALAHELPEHFPALMSQLQAPLFEHYEPYQEAVAAGELPYDASTFPQIQAAEAVWPYVTPVHVLIERVRGVPTIEIAFTVAWDEEHTVAGRFQDWQLAEFCGSV